MSEKYIKIGKLKITESYAEQMDLNKLVHVLALCSNMDQVNLLKDLAKNEEFNKYVEDFSEFAKHIFFGEETNEANN